MAKPAGAVEAGSDYTYDISHTDSDTPVYMYHIQRLLEMPQEWTDRSLTVNNLISVQPQFEIDDADQIIEVSCYPRSGDDNAKQDYTYFGQMDTIENYIDGNPVWSSTMENAGSFTGKTFKYYPGSKKPRYHTMEIKANANWDGFTTEHAAIHGFKMEQYYDDSFVGDDAWTCYRNATGTQYMPDNFVSAWHVKSLLIETLNKMMYENRNYRSFVAFGFVPDPGVS